MSLAVLKSRALAGMAAPEVTVEVHLGRGLPAFAIVGLADTEVKEARERVRAAIQNARFEFPASRITVNLPIEHPIRIWGWNIRRQWTFDLEKIPGSPPLQP